ncbi:Ribulose-phosphate 3-epimerase [Serratia rubidaea]|uniref:Ribulose-phosphate 3-epimerase n=1 Tax=Serratia rubidaea TaxID=61652 RepID=A0A4U9HUK5_SERRU|nr:Ribulose-phosphate 3-epimerase [Serratia rubidaea]
MTTPTFGEADEKEFDCPVHSVGRFLPAWGEDTANVLAAGADVVHFDVMDNHYVPNLTIGPMVCQALRNYGITAPIDVHLMVKPVDRIIRTSPKPAPAISLSIPKPPSTSTAPSN